MDFPFFALLVLVTGFTMVAMVWDIRTRRIPNWLTVSGFVAGLVYQTIFSGFAGLLAALGGFGVGFGILFVLWLIGGGGAGDVKFAGALGVWLGAPLMFIAFVLSAFLALFVSLVAIVYCAASRAPVSNAPSGGGMKKTMLPGRQVPYAVPLTLATWIVLVVKFVTIHTQ